MKWIPKMISFCIVATLVIAQVVSPHESVLTELIYNLLIVFFLLGLGESMLVLSWYTLTKSGSLFSTTKLKNK